MFKKDNMLQKSRLNMSLYKKFFYGHKYFLLEIFFRPLSSKVTFLKFLGILGRPFWFLDIYKCPFLKNGGQTQTRFFSIFYKGLYMFL